MATVDPLSLFLSACRCGLSRAVLGLCWGMRLDCCPASEHTACTSRELRPKDLCDIIIMAASFSLILRSCRFSYHSVQFCNALPLSPRVR